jgi:hypothetical protein
MKFTKYLLTVVSISGLLACGGGAGGNAGNTGNTLASGIDVTHINQLMVAPPGISSGVLASIGKSLN